MPLYDGNADYGDGPKRRLHKKTFQGWGVGKSEVAAWVQARGIKSPLLKKIFLAMAHLVPEPGNPLVYTLAGGTGDLDYFRPIVQVFNRFAVGHSVKFQVRKQVHLVDEHNIGHGEHQRILKGLIIPLRGA